jgi:hypothetical protein
LSYSRRRARQECDGETTSCGSMLQLEIALEHRLIPERKVADHGMNVKE